MVNISPMTQLQEQYLKSYEVLSNVISSSLLDLSSTVTEISNIVSTTTDWQFSLGFDYTRVLSNFLAPLTWEIPESVIEAFREHRADVLLEMQLQFLLDVTDSAIDEYASRLHQLGTDARPTEITKYLHHVTTQGTFINELMNSMALVPRAKHRRKIVSAAIQAHAERNYFLSIPALLPQVEALTKQILAKARFIRWDSTKGAWFELDRKTGTYRLNEKTGKRIQVNGLGSLKKLAIPQAHHPIPQGLPLISGKMAQYRNDVLHGSLVSYGKPRESSRLVLLVRTLIGILEAMYRKNSGDSQDV